MKKVYFIILLVNVSLQAQEWKVAEKSVTGVFDVNKTKSELFALINKWISINYNSAQNVIQMNDAESGTIIIKGINEVVYSNLPAKVLQPNSKYVLEKTSTKFNHTIEVNIKDNKFRVVYTLTDAISPNPAGDIFASYFFNSVNLTGENTEALKAYNDETEKYLKQGLIGKEKREKYKQAMVEMFTELNKTIVENMKITMMSIEKSAKTEDKW
ncbi:MAG: DUF4468 domain-containing protein [Flavobacterium sp. JAD_PAG50586_2]|nr:MAG: DUF4468 domain-containing protein [Flavobacterium sp. JAD_PAG50586_2]